MSAQVEILLIAIFISVSCAIPGVFLVLRSMSMIADSITHTILLGIVIAFFITGDLSSPLLIVGASVVGVFTAWLTESVKQTRLVAEDAAIGIVFPLLFSVAIILVSQYAGSVHLDTDSVLLGELAFAPFDRMIVFGNDIGARGIYNSLILLIINISFVVLLFKELKIVTFDSTLANVMGFSSTLVFYLLMCVVSLSAVISFEAVGSILVVSYMIGPAATAYLISDDLKRMLGLSMFFAALSSIIGYNLAVVLDVSIAGMIAVTCGIIFVLIFVCSPKRGIVGILLQKKRRKLNFEEITMLLHIYNHKRTSEEKVENSINTISEHLNWDSKQLLAILNRLLNKKDLVLSKDIISLTSKGEIRMKDVMETIFK